jgi:hypothetical protein
VIQRNLESEDVRKRENHQTNIRDDSTNRDSDIELGKIDTVLLRTVPKRVNGPTCTDGWNVLVLVLVMRIEYLMHREKPHTVEMAQETMRKTNPWRK